MGRMIAHDLGHCGTIASSALTLAAERSLDIDVPMVATLIMLKVLCEKNIQAEMDRPVPPELEGMAKAIGRNHKQIQKEGLEALESVINDYFDYTGGKQVEIKV
jgi:hypothetical protein